MKLLLDTHVLIWALTDPSKLSARATELIQSRENQLVASSASAWEIATKYRLGKLPQLEATVQSYESQLKTLGALTLDVSVRHALLAGQLTWQHADPFDRMLAAQSMLESTPLITSDKAFTALPAVHVLW